MVVTTTPAAAHHSAAGVVVTSPAGEVLMVHTHNRGRDSLVLPGGVVEYGEAPAVAAEREVTEELGLQLRVTRLLVMQHKPALEGGPGSLMFVFDSPSIRRDTALVLQPEEVAAVFWLDPDSAVTRHTEAGQARLRAALEARRDGRTIYMDADRVLPG
ncbi:MAG: NUDIX domain-containing protein [Nocardioidaceae bacterium]